jgi:hypothetical protein
MIASAFGWPPDVLYNLDDWDLKFWSAAATEKLKRGVL